MSVVYGLILFALVAAFVLAPVVRARGAGPDKTEDPRLADLEARREAKYREIRDTELDHAAGKISDEDFARQDAELRNDAIAILEELDEAKGEPEPEAAEGDVAAADPPKGEANPPSS